MSISRLPVYRGSSFSRTAAFIRDHTCTGFLSFFFLRSPSLLSSPSSPLSFSLSVSFFFYRSSKSNHPVCHPRLSPLRDAHYRNVSVTAFKNVNLPYSHHCPVDAKCSLARIPIVDFGGDVATHPRCPYGLGAV